MLRDLGLETFKIYDEGKIVIETGVNRGTGKRVCGSFFGKMGGF